MASPRAVLVSGFWGQNIGNAFFNLGGRWLLEQSLPSGVEVTWFQDQPGYRTFNNQAKGNPRNDAGLIAQLDIDYLVLQGPMLTQTFRALWEPTFAALRDRGVKIVLLSAGLFRYTEDEIREATAFLRAYPPAIITTRDSETFKHVATLAPHTYDGIESAFCVPDAFTPPALHAPATVAVCFDRYPEPDFQVSRTSAPRLPGKHAFEFDGTHWEWSSPRLPTALASLGPRAAYLGTLLDRRELSSTLGRWDVLRPEHRTAPFVGWKVFKRPGSVASDEPFTYLTTYAHAELTLSDRVHACVAAIAYGRPAMLFTSTPRAHLFDRVGLEGIREAPVCLPEARRVAERDALVSFLREAFAAISR